MSAAAVDRPAQEFQIEYELSDSSGNQDADINTDEISDALLFAEMEQLFKALNESQTPVEPEFQSALYSNRSEMYSLF